ncbi:Uncharacterised protein [Vibrio cholerae]|nr:Uncharacterised protein [Vibrio cholerae]
MGLHQLITEFEFFIKLGDAFLNLVEIEVDVFIQFIDYTHNQFCQIGWALAGFKRCTHGTDRFRRCFTSRDQRAVIIENTHTEHIRRIRVIVKIHPTQDQQKVLFIILLKQGASIFGQQTVDNRRGNILVE